ncbi:hypothetical protein SDC9_71898 [bioreactor metagenome]|uniref:Uncharacterized protein n=1 Tax=bioreactor metagenome TaxID=1076179 RepID=A0A644YH14_9ZZZZ
MKHSVAGVVPDLLAPVYLDRFVALFGVAARKSLIEWKRAPTSDAQLALLDASSRGDVVPASTPCVIYVGQTADVAEKARTGRWVSHLPAEFTVSDLIDALDRAAVFLMDWRARQRMAAAKVDAAAPAVRAEAARPSPESASQAAAPADDLQYQLTSWVSLEAPFNVGGCVRAMALLTRAPITLQQLCHHSGLDTDTAQALIANLHGRGVLRRTVRQTALGGSNANSVANAQAAQAAPQPAHQPAHRGRSVGMGLIQRLTRWVRVGGKV